MTSVSLPMRRSSRGGAQARPQRRGVGRCRGTAGGSSTWPRGPRRCAGNTRSRRGARRGLQPWLWRWGARPSPPLRKRKSWAHAVVENDLRSNFLEPPQVRHRARGREREVEVLRGVFEGVINTCGYRQRRNGAQTSGLRSSCLQSVCTGRGGEAETGASTDKLWSACSSRHLSPQRLACQVILHGVKSRAAAEEAGQAFCLLHSSRSRPCP